MSIAWNMSEIRNRMTAAAERVGRKPESVTLVAVTKTVEEPAMRELFAAGQTRFAENRPQCLRDKSRAMSDLAIRWHMIGTLQSNKIKYVYPLAELVHSIDRRELLDEFAAWSAKTNRICPCLLEVHISDEESKHGFGVEDVLEVIREYRERPGLAIRGLMGMAPFTDDQEKVRAAFRTLRGLFDKSRELAGPSYEARELSMGMSDDFEIAIEEGATIVRVGRALFE